MKKQILKVIALFFFLGVPVIFFLACQGFALGTADYGDNPDTYLTFGTSNGPHHLNGDYAWFGLNRPDYELDGQPTANSDGDDLSINFTYAPAIDDEDGITFLGNTVQILVNVYDGDGMYSKDNPLYIDGWIDWGHDGTYADAGDHVVALITTPSLEWGGADSMTFTYTFSQTIDAPSRWRVSYDEGPNNYYGQKFWGEVEDYGNPVPEPSTILLLCFGLIGFAGFNRKSRRA